MLRQIVESSALRSIGYDEEKMILEAEFKSGKVYQYNEVPMEVFQNLINAESKGKFFNQNITNVYSFIKA